MTAGPELDALVAEKILKTVPCKSWVVIQHTLQGPIFSLMPGCGHESHGCYPEGYAPKYSSDIGAAWRVVEKMRELYLFDMDDHDGIWGARFFLRSDLAKYGFGVADTAPLAICLAAVQSSRHDN